jgi:hypothetical protein
VHKHKCSKGALLCNFVFTILGFLVTLKKIKNGNENKLKCVCLITNIYLKTKVVFKESVSMVPENNKAGFKTTEKGRAKILFVKHTNMPKTVMEDKIK